MLRYRCYVNDTMQLDHETRRRLLDLRFIIPEHGQQRLDGFVSLAVGHAAIGCNSRGYRNLFRYHPVVDGLRLRYCTHVQIVVSATEQRILAEGFQPGRWLRPIQGCSRVGTPYLAQSRYACSGKCGIRIIEQGCDAWNSLFAATLTDRPDHADAQIAFEFIESLQEDPVDLR